MALTSSGTSMSPFRPTRLEWLMTSTEVRD
jgi:hypothetical protein